MASLPERTRVYQHHHLDSTRWDSFTPRPDDIVIATPYKAGTTWTQAIVGNLIFPAGLPAPISDLSPWLDNRVKPLAEVLAEIQGSDRHPHQAGDRKQTRWRMSAAALASGR